MIDAVLAQLHAVPVIQVQNDISVQLVCTGLCHFSEHFCPSVLHHTAGCLEHNRRMDPVRCPGGRLHDLHVVADKAPNSPISGQAFPVDLLGRNQSSHRGHSSKVNFLFREAGCLTGTIYNLAEFSKKV